jgi:cystine transport system substrate-binding protein
MQSKTIRASYAVYPPYCIQNPNDGTLSGLCVDTLNEAGRRLQLRIEWVEEVGWGTVFEGLNANRHDIFGAGIWRNSDRGKVGDFSRPIIFNPIKAYGRPDESRLEQPALINASSVRISVKDGAMEDLIARSDYPNAQRISIPDSNPWTDVLLNITSGKADVTFAEPSAVNLFLEKNPGTLKDLYPTKVIRIFPLTFAYKQGEADFAGMLDAAIEEMQNDGTLERIIRSYEKQPGEFYRVALPYAMPPSQ